jgi:fatty-acyl-CoA synthase
VVREPVNPDALRAHAAGRLAPYKVPKRIEFIGELPRNALGKVLRNEL